MFWQPKLTIELNGINKINDEEQKLKVYSNNKYEILKKNGNEILLDADDYLVWVNFNDGTLIKETNFMEGIESYCD